MKNLLRSAFVMGFGCGIAALSFSSGADATDLPSKKAPASMPVAATKIYDWSGFYVGGTIGAGNSSVSFVDVNGRFSHNPQGTQYSSSADGVTFGVRGGFNHQIDSRFVLGLETDVHYNSASSSNGYDGGSDLITTKAHYLGSTRARVGMSAGDALFFASGGLAYGDPTSKTNNSSDADLFDDSSTHFGYAVGGGIEYRLSSQWSASVEGIYYKLNKFSHDGVCAGENCGYRIDVNYNQLVAQIGLNYHF